MAWSDLQPNQMADEANAVTGGFTAIGTKLSPTNKCYTKAEAQTAYSLQTAPMSGFANNQLVPKSTWVASAAALNYVSLGYEGTNTLFADQGGNTFLQARLTANGNGSPYIQIGCYRRTAPSTEFPIFRGFLGFNGALVPVITNGGIKINIAAASNNTLTTATKFVAVRTGVSFPFNHVWVQADYDECINFIDEAGNTIYTEVVTIVPGQLGDVLMPFNTAGLNYVNSNTDLNFVIMEYDHDWAKVAPTTALTTNDHVTCSSNLVKLYYQ